MSLNEQAAFLRLAGYLRPLLKQAGDFDGETLSPVSNSLGKLMSARRWPTAADDLMLVRRKAGELLSSLQSAVPKVQQANRVFVGQKTKTFGPRLMKAIRQACDELSSALSDASVRAPVGRVVANRIAMAARDAHKVICDWEYSQGRRLFGLWEHEFYLLGRDHFPPELFDDPDEWIRASKERLRKNSSGRPKRDVHLEWKRLREQGDTFGQIAKKHNLMQGTNGHRIKADAVRRALGRLN